METFFKMLFALLLTAADALFAWWIFPDAVLDLGYWDWFKASIVITGMVSTAIITHDLHKD